MARVDFSFDTAHKIEDICRKLRRDASKVVFVGILDEPAVATYGMYVEFGWTQRVTAKQHYAFRAWWGINRPIGSVLYNPPRPFMRGTLAAQRTTWRDLAANYLVMHDWNIVNSLAFIGQVATNDVKQTIATGQVTGTNYTFPLRSDFTMTAYAARGAGHRVTNGNITTRKPLVLTGAMMHITYRVE